MEINFKNSKKSYSGVWITDGKDNRKVPSMSGVPLGL